MQVKRKSLVTSEGAAVMAAVLGRLIVALAGGLLAVLAIENFTTLMIEVPLTVFGWHAPILPLGVVVLLSCLLGALLLYSVSVLSALRDRRALAKLRRRVAELEQAQGALTPQRSAPSLTAPLLAIQAKQPPTLPSASKRMRWDATRLFAGHASKR